MEKYLPTGNEAISVPRLNEAGAVEDDTFLHMGCKGLIDLRGAREEALMAPFVEADGRAAPLEELRASFRRHPQGDAIRQRFAYPVQDERPGGTDGKTMPAPMTTRHILVGRDALLFFDAKEILRALPHTATAAHAARRVDIKMVLHMALRMSGMPEHPGFRSRTFSVRNALLFQLYGPSFRGKNAVFRALSSDRPPCSAASRLTFQGQNAPGGVRRRNGSRNAAWAPPLPVRKESASCQGRRRCRTVFRTCPAPPVRMPTVFPFNSHPTSPSFVFPALQRASTCGIFLKSESIIHIVNSATESFEYPDALLSFIPISLAVFTST